MTSVWRSWSREAMLPLETTRRIDDQIVMWNELSPWNTILWPFQRITYTRFGFSIVYCLYTIVGQLCLVLLAISAIIFIPTSIFGYICRLSFHSGQGYPRYTYPWSLLEYWLQEILVRDCWLHNVSAPHEYQVTIDFDANSSDTSRTQLRGPQFVIRMKRDGWTKLHHFKVILYLLCIRTFFLFAFLTWFRLIEDVFNLCLEGFNIWFLDPNADDHRDFFWGGDISCRAHAVGCLGCGLIEIYMLVVIRTFLVRAMNWTTRHFCCESVLLLNTNSFYSGS